MLLAGDDDMATVAIQACMFHEHQRRAMLTTRVIIIRNLIGAHRQCLSVG